MRERWAAWVLKSNTLGHARCRRVDTRGLEVSLGGLSPDQLVEGNVGDAFARPAVLELPALQGYRSSLMPNEILQVGPLQRG